MRRLTVAVLLCGSAFAPAACKRAAQHLNPGIELLSVLPMDDPHAGAQLVRGFYSLEGNPWRWTAGKFSVILRPPPGAAQNGARLELKLNIPDAVFQQLGAITLSATAGRSSLAPEKFTESGSHVYARDVTASALAGDRVSFEFSTDKAIPAGQIEKRELALIVTSVGLVSK
ncbi:MAG TPA: hypothetical protein VE958_14425 [Bryobacteraceae bacterium]|jgi:hypothetical protein|nr:hypothetical protein [Bryobacteraceae bacterium]